MSAADLTKLAILRLENNAEWKKLGGRLLVPVHDELICELPLKYAERGGEVLSGCMSEAGNFLPFPINCDVTTTFRWGGLEYPCPYVIPSVFDSNKLNDLTKDEVKWIQYYLVEMEYLLPVFKEENGDEPRGDAAQGINGRVTKELEDAIFDFEVKHKIDDDVFVSYIYQLAEFGRVDERI